MIVVKRLLPILYFLNKIYFIIAIVERFYLNNAEWTL